MFATPLYSFCWNIFKSKRANTPSNNVNPLSSVYGYNTGYTSPFKLPCCHTDNAALIEQKWWS